MARGLVLTAVAVLCVGGFYLAAGPRTLCLTSTNGVEKLVTKVSPNVSSSPSPVPQPASPVAAVSVMAPGPSVVQQRCQELGNDTDMGREKGCKAPRPRCRLEYSQLIHSTMCPIDVWVDAMVQMDPNPDKVILNIGCNKGHDSIQWLQRFDQHGFWSLSDWSKSMPSGFCKLHTQVPRPPRYQSSAVPMAICVEAMPATVEMLKKVQTVRNYNNHSQSYGRLEILHYAATDVSAPGAVVEFSDGAAGKETTGIGLENLRHHQGLKTVKVPTTTVDTIAQTLALNKVDILLVDTEGADPAVLRGASETLKSVRYLMFETHRDLPNTDWASHSIKSVVQYLAVYGFECYWMGENGNAFSITQCYEPLFEKFGMGNIACVKKNDVWYEVLDRYDPNSVNA